MTSPKELIFEEKARDQLASGINALADAAEVTLGPSGRNVGLDSSYKAPTITNDGYSIIKDIELKDQYLNMGVSLGQEVASKIKDACGDGTTTGIVLLRALVKQGVKNIASGANPIDIKRGIEKGVSHVLSKIDAMSKTVQSDEDLLNIATVSASGNSQIGKTIYDALKKVGSSGVITIEEGKGRETEIDMVEGMRFDRGFLSVYFCTNSETMKVEMNNPHILIVDKKISSIQELLPILQTLATTNDELLIIAEDIDSDALSTLVINRLRGTLKVCAVKAPGFGDRRGQLLEDIAVLTGATVISEDKGLQLKETEVSSLGRAERIEITKDHTTIISGQGEKEAIQNRVQQINNDLLHQESSYEKEKLEERRAKLSSGIAVIRVGGHSEPEMQQSKQVFEDSLSSTKAAKESGFVPGGGISLLRASLTIDELDLESDEKLGAMIVKKALEAPTRQIIHNTGFDPSLMVEKILQSGDSFGFNAKSENIEDLLLSNIVDPTMVVKSALQFAASTTGIVLLSEALIGDAPEDDE